MFFNLDQVTLYSDSRPLLKNLTYSFEKNKRYFFFGRSGVGKSLLLETLSGIYPHFSGQVERPSDTAKHSSFLFQRDSLVLWLSVKENFELVGIDSTQALAVLKGFEFEKLFEKSSAVLSVGETQIVSLARAVLYNPKYLFYDEPFTGLDYFSKKKAYRFLLEFLDQQKELSFFGVSHDLEEVCLLADVVLFLDIEKQILSQVLPKSEINFSNLQNLLKIHSYV